MAITFRNENDRKIVEGWLTVQAAQTLYRLAERGIIGRVEGVLREGKESVIILARDPKEKPLIIKVYKIATSNFRRMQQYIIGDPRFRAIKKDRRHLVFAWCKKEFANLRRATKAGVRCPEPIVFADNILIMSFIGDAESGQLAPELHQVDFEDAETSRQFFDEIVAQYRLLYQKAGLIHGDLSQFNILVHDNEPWLIDLSAAVLKEHPNAETFLARDVKNLCAFFRKVGVEVDENGVLASIKT